MRTLTSIFSVLALTLALGCGGGDGDDDPVVVADSGPTADSMPSGPDAMPANPPVTSGLGQVCSASVQCAVPETNSCIAFAMGATEGLCTPICAPNLPMGTNPETAASQTCTDNYTGTTGTALCITGVGQEVGTNVDWHCGIGCGVIETTDFGGCPGGLTCTNNRCIP